MCPLIFDFVNNLYYFVWKPSTLGQRVCSLVLLLLDWSMKTFFNETLTNARHNKYVFFNVLRSEKPNLLPDPSSLFKVRNNSGLFVTEELAQ